MRYPKILFAALAIIMAATVFHAAGAAAKSKPRCVFCPMTVTLPGDPQAGKIIYKNGTEEYYCSMAHAIKGWHLAAGPSGDTANPPDKLIVGDYKSNKLINASKAAFVAGSDVKPCMKSLKESIIAFSSAKAARHFIKKHGGRIVSFEELLKMFPL